MKKKISAFVLVVLAFWIVGTGILITSAPPIDTDGRSIRSSGTIIYPSTQENGFNEQLNQFSGDPLLGSGKWWTCVRSYWTLPESLPL